jgi:hypothetical protein
MKKTLIALIILMNLTVLHKKKIIQLLLKKRVLENTEVDVLLLQTRWRTFAS